MPALIKVPLPPGSLGVSFKGSPPTITKVSPTSSLKGKVEEGYIVDSFISEDGTEHKDLATPDLVKALGAEKDSEGRKLCLQITVPQTGSVDLPRGSLGITFAGSPPVVKSVADDSPLKGLVQVGAVVDTLTMSLAITGLTAEGLEKTLNDNSGMGRTLTLGSKVRDPSTRGLPVDDLFNTTVLLPPGSVGVRFRSSPPKVIKVRETSPVKGIVQEGAIVAAFIADGQEVTDFSSSELVSLLEANRDSEDRQIKFTGVSLPDKMTVTVPAGDHGVSFTGTPPTITGVSDDSPVKDTIKIGAVVEAIAFTGDDMEYAGLDTDELEKMLEEHKEETRTLHLRYKLPDTLVVTLPPGKTGLTIEGSPPTITSIQDEALKRELDVNYIVESVTFEDGTEYSGLDTGDLLDLLEAHNDFERTLLVKLPGSGSLTLGHPSILCPLPPGSLGVTFKGTPPRITNIGETSALEGKVKVGYTVETLLLEDGSELTSMSTKNLVKALSNESESDSRKILFNITYPDTMTLDLPAGSPGLELSGEQATITSLARESPLRGKVKAGYVVESLTLPDGTIFTGLSASEMDEELDSSNDMQDRQIDVALPQVASMAPPSVTVPLPVGSLGVSFKGTPPVVTNFSATSAMQDKIKVGYEVDTLFLGDEELSGLSTKALISHLGQNSDSADRKLRLNIKYPESMTVTLPPGDPGMQIGGSPPAIESIDAGNPLKKQIKAGYVVESLILDEVGMEYTGLPTEQLLEKLEEHANEEDRRLYIALPEHAMSAPPTVTIEVPSGSLGPLNFRGSPPEVTSIGAKSPLNGKVDLGYECTTLVTSDGAEKNVSSTAELVAALGSSSNDEGRRLIFNIKLPKTATLDLPAGKLGVFFKSTPPTITGFRPESPLAKHVQVGYVVQKLVLADGSEYSGMTTSELVGMIGSTAGTEGRKIVVSMTEPEIPIPQAAKVMLPPGKLGVFFKGTPPRVTSVNDDSPLNGRIPTGYSVERVAVGDMEYGGGFKTKELLQILGDHIGETDRILYLTGELADFIPGTPPTIKLTVPAGSLGLSFKGSPPVVTNVPLDSPFKGIIKAGYKVEALYLENGEELRGLSTKQLVTTLGAHYDATGRQLLLSMLIPDSAEVVLPPGSLGLSFKGTPPKVTRISDDSPLAGKIQVGMVAECLVLNDGTVFDDLTTPELTGGLKETSGTRGRQMTFKNPEPHTVPSPRASARTSSRSVNSAPARPASVRSSGSAKPSSSRTVPAAAPAPAPAAQPKKKKGLKGFLSQLK